MKQVFIYGSCVSRDTVDTFGPDWKITRYVARQSFISAAHGQARLKGKPSLESAFQTRCVEGDIRGDAVPRLRSAVDSVSLVLLDIIDERFGVYETLDDRYITNTWELKDSGLLTQQPTPLRLVDFGSDEHLDLFTNAAHTISQIADEGVAQFLVLAPPLASVNDQAASLEYRNESIHAWNARFAPYYATLEKLGFTLVSPNAVNVQADTKHKWGPAPFHYTQSVYDELRESILIELEQR